LIAAYSDFEKKVSHEKHDMIQQLSLTESYVNEVTNQNISKMIGVTTFISMNTDIDIEELNYFVQKVVHSENNLISNIGIFKDTTAIYLYPYEPNKSMNNINLVELPPFKNDALRVKNDLIVVITRPEEVVQGGIGIITRMPITLPDGSYWGQLGYMMKLDDIIGNLFLEADNYSYLITQYNSYNNLSHTVYDSGFEANLLVDGINIKLPSGYWTVQIGYNNLPGLTSPVFYILIFSAILFFGLSRYVILKLENSEQKLSTTINSIKAFVFVMTDTGFFLSVNESMLEHLGLDEQDIFGKSYNNDSLKELLSFIPYESFSNRDTNEISITAAVSFTNQNIEKKWLHTTLQRINNNIFGEPVIIGTSTDITKIKDFENKLRSSERRFETAINQAPVPIMLFDDVGQVINVNKRWSDLSGYELKDIPTRKDWLEKASILPEIKTEKIFTTLFEGNDLIHVGESSILCADGTPRIWDFNSVHLGTSLNERKLLMTVANDITEKRKLQEQLLHKSKMDVIGQLAGGIAHDFNNVLNGIVSSAQLLQMKQCNLNEKALSYIDLILKASSRASSLSSKLLTFSRNNKTSFKSVDLHRLIGEIEEMLFNTIDKNIQIQIELNAGFFVVYGDENELHNCLLNLCLNATQAMSSGGNLSIRTENRSFSEEYQLNEFKLEIGKYIWIEIMDSGTGISEKNLSKIFEPFFSTKAQGEGTGLGLATVYGVILDHKGMIEVESEINKGTSFRLMLPLSSEVAEQDDFEIVKQGKGLILFVDDEEINRVVGSDTLDLIGYEVITASGGSEALEIYKQSQKDIDLVIIDFMMPGMNGIETFIQMREFDSDCKIILSSGYSDHEDIKKMRQLGLNGELKKPYRIDELSQLLENVLSK